MLAVGPRRASSAGGGPLAVKTKSGNIIRARESSLFIRATEVRVKKKVHVGRGGLANRVKGERGERVNNICPGKNSNNFIN